VHGERRRGRSRARILYWFRTPPGVRVGRAALDPEAIRLIEQRNPDLTFDWTRILKGEGGEPQERRRPERAERVRPERVERARPERPHPDRQPPARPAPMPEPVSAPIAPAAEFFPVPPEDPAATPETAALETATLEAAFDAAPAPVPDTPAGRRLGAEGLARLRARYSEVLARIDEKATDPAQQAELKARAERLNPDGWVTDEEVVAGLEQYEAVSESLRAIVGRRRARRSR
jgi:hypothetical protein